MLHDSPRSTASMLRKAGGRRLAVVLAVATTLLTAVTVTRLVHTHHPTDQVQLLPLTHPSGPRALTCQRLASQLSLPRSPLADQTFIFDSANVELGHAHTASGPLHTLARTQHQWHNCTIAECLDWQRPGCQRADGQILFYLYPTNEQDTPLDSDFYLWIVRTIKEELGYLLTSDPAEACFFVPTHSMLSHYRNHGLDPPTTREMDAYLQRLPFWNGTGANHILFKYSDQDYNVGSYGPPLSKVRWYAPYNTTERQLQMAAWNESSHRQWHKGILVDSIASYSNFRWGFDVTTPLFPLMRPDIHRRDVSVERSYFTGGDQYLLTFKGTAYSPTHVRSLLIDKLHNGNDVVVVGEDHSQCGWRNGKEWKEGNVEQRLAILASLTDGERIAEERCDRYDRAYAAFDYDKLLLDTSFVLCAAGDGLHIYRVTETLAAGAIPVFVSEDHQLPFSELLDWRDFSFRFNERQLSELVPFLRSLSHQQVVRMKRRALEVHQRYFASTKLAVATVFQIIQQRVAEARYERESCDAVNW